MREQAMSGAPPAQTRDVSTLRGHVGVLDGVRGLAIALVLLLHFVGGATPTNVFEKAGVTIAGWGQHGVDLFFVLSGFLITGILYDARRDAHFFRNFYMRRVLRIFPLYYGVLVVLFLVLPHVPAFDGPLLQNLERHQAWTWLYGVNVYSAMHRTWPLPYIDHFWSLAVEEHFYFLWPFVVWGLGKKPRTLMIVSLAVAAGSVSLRVGCSLAGVGEHALYVLTPFRLDGLALGGFLAVLARQPGGLDRIARGVPRFAALAISLLVGRAVWAHTVGSGIAVLKPMRESLVVIALTCFVMWGVTSRPEARVYKALTSRPLTFLGKYSYGLYVYHHFFSYYASTHDIERRMTDLLGSHLAAIIAIAAVGFLASILCAYVSYELYEKRFLSFKRWFEHGGARGADREPAMGRVMALAVASPEKITPPQDK